MRKAIIGPILVLVFWQLGVEMSGVSPLLLPSPGAVAGALSQLIGSGVVRDVCWTLGRLILGLLIGAAGGIACGLVLGRFQITYDMLEVVIDFFRSIPVAAMFPLFLVVFGIGDASKIATISWAVGFVVLINTMYGVRHVSRLRIMAARTLGAGPLQILSKVIFFDALPEVAVGLRQALGIGAIVAIMTEMLTGTEYGLGQRIFEASLTYRVPEMYAAILLAGALGYLLNRGFVLIETRIVHWAGR